MQKLTQEMLDLRWPKDVQRSVLLEVFHKCAEGISSPIRNFQHLATESSKKTRASVVERLRLT